MLSKKARPRKTHRTPWQRMALSVFGIIMIDLARRAGIHDLYTLRVEAIAGAVTLNTQAFYVQGAIVVFMISGRLFYDWKFNTGQQIEERGEQLIEDVRTVPSRNVDDGSVD